MNPLRAILSELVDFESLRLSPSVQLLIAATRVSDGKLRIFREDELTADVALASSCLPLLHHAVTIDGVAYWTAATRPILLCFRLSPRRRRGRSSSFSEFETYGYRRVGGALRQAGMIVNHKRSV